MWADKWAWEDKLEKLWEEWEGIVKIEEWCCFDA